MKHMWVNRRCQQYLSSTEKYSLGSSTYCSLLNCCTIVCMWCCVCVFLCVCECAVLGEEGTTSQHCHSFPTPHHTHSTYQADTLNKVTHWGWWRQITRQALHSPLMYLPNLYGCESGRHNSKQWFSMRPGRVTSMWLPEYMHHTQFHFSGGHYSVRVRVNELHTQYLQDTPHKEASSNVSILTLNGNQLFHDVFFLVTMAMGSMSYFP